VIRSCVRRRFSRFHHLGKGARCKIRGTAAGRLVVIFPAAPAALGPVWAFTVVRFVAKRKAAEAPDLGMSHSDPTADHADSQLSFFGQAPRGFLRERY